MNEYLISLIVPVYNCKKYLNKCIDSLINQTYSNIEIMLVDDGSTDGSSDICDKYSELDERIKVIHKKNGGLVSAWKCGVEESKGQYLCFVDGDDWVDINMLEELSLKLTGSDGEIIASDYIIERQIGDGQYNSETVYQTLTPGDYNRGELEEKVIPILLGNENRPVFFSRCMKLISRELILSNIKYCDESIKMAEDVVIMLSALIDCKRLYVMNHKAYYHYLLVTDSMVHKYDSGLYNNLCRLNKVCVSLLKDKGREDLVPGWNKEMVLLLFLCIKNEIRGNVDHYIENIKDILEKEKTLLSNNPVEVKSLNNKLIYWVMKKPNILNLKLLKLCFSVADKK